MMSSCQQNNQSDTMRSSVERHFLGQQHQEQSVRQAHDINFALLVWHTWMHIVKATIIALSITLNED